MPDENDVNPSIIDDFLRYLWRTIDDGVPWREDPDYLAQTVPQSIEG